MPDKQSDAYVTARRKLINDLAERFRQFQKVPGMDHTDLMDAAKEAYDQVVSLPKHNDEQLSIKQQTNRLQRPSGNLPKAKAVAVGIIPSAPTTTLKFNTPPGDPVTPPKRK